MRGRAPEQQSMLCLRNPGEMVPKDHPLRDIKKLADECLGGLDSEFERMYSKRGRPSIPPERLLKSMVLMALYSIRSDVQLCEQIEYNLLYRWFLDMDMVEHGWDPSTFSKNRERLLEHEIAARFFDEVWRVADEGGLTSREHFSADGTLIEAWASMKSFRPKDEDDDEGPHGPRSNGWVNFHGEKRSNETHESKTDPEARLMRKGNGKEAKLSFSAHALMENRNGLIRDFRIAEANGRAEREVAIEMLEGVPGQHPITVGADRGYDTRDFVAQCRRLGATPHVTQYRKGKGRRSSAIDARTTRHPGYEISQRIRRRIEGIFGWLKTVGGFRKSRFRGKRRSGFYGRIAAATYNLIRIAKLSPAPS